MEEKREGIQGECCMSGCLEKANLVSEILFLLNNIFGISNAD